MTKNSGSINQTQCTKSKGIASIRTSSSNSSHQGQPYANSSKDQDKVVLKNDQQQSSSTTTTTTSSSSITDDHAASPSTDSSTPDIKPSPADQAPAAGRKRALLCGVTYGTGENRDLKGTKNDVNEIKKMLIQQLGFPEKSIRILKEEEENRNHHDDLTPTKKNIEASLKWLVEGSESGDSLVFYFSGHGGRYPLEHPNGITESYICCSDFRVESSEGIIPNKDINSAIVRPLKEGVTLHAIVDACHSGNLLDLKYKYDLQKSNIDEGTWIDKKPAKLSEADKLGTSGGLAICLSACEDDQTAPESNASSPDKIMGIMTLHLIEIVKDHPDVTYKDILQKLLRLHVNSNKRACLSQEHLQGNFSRELSKSKRIEKPVLSSSSSSLEPRGVVLSKKFLQ